ncbi:unnamed protein product [Prunus armeniaca]
MALATSHLPFGRLPSEAWKESSRHVVTSHLPFGRHDDVIPSLRKAPFRSLEGVLTTRGDVTPSLRKAPFRSLERVLVMTSHLPFGRHDDVTPSLRKA